MKLIKRQEIIKFPLDELVQYQFVLYNYDYVSKDILHNNSFNKYLLDNNLQVMEEMLDDVIEYLQSKGHLYNLKYIDRSKEYYEFKYNMEDKD